MEKRKDLATNIGNTSLSGKPGIIYGLISIGFIYLISFLTTQYSSGAGVSFLPISFFEILIIVLVLIFLAISYFTITLINKKRRKKIGVVGWDSQSKTIRKVFLIAFLLFCLATFIIYKNGFIKYVFPLSLCFYGLACIVVKRLTNGPTFPLGLFFILQAILCLIQPDIMFLLWEISFGLGHIVYGFTGKFKPKEFNT
jgi:uncharacterized membrane protein YhdT